MQFNSYSYLLLLFPVTLVFWILPFRARRWWLLALSILFYASWAPAYIGLPLFVCLIAYIGARGITKGDRASGLWFRCGIGIILGTLAFFKYRDFLAGVVGNVLPVTGELTSMIKLMLPLGISFYSFEAISYLVDTKQGRTRDVKLGDLCLFITFWPHLIAGPIVRVRELVPQFGKNNKFSFDTFLSGVDRLIVGLVMKNVLANSLAPFIEEGFLPHSAGTNSGLDNWFLALAFGLQIYFDFAAYSHMAIGTAKLLGITLPENFRFPYHAANPADFWSRWHMTLSRWIRDYLFFPLNARFEATRGRLYACLILIMGLVGLWHGAGWGFITWGLLHGVYLVAYRVWENSAGRKSHSETQRLWTAAVWQTCTLIAVIVAWVPFRSGSLAQAATMLRAMFSDVSPRISYSVNYYLITILFAFIAFVEPWIWNGLDRLRRVSATNWVPLEALFVRPVLYANALFLFLLFDNRDVRFIYFQF